MITFERCATGRLRNAYPVSENDLEVDVSDPALLWTATTQALVAEPACRRIIYAVPEGDLAGIEAAEAAGFRYVVDVDLPDGSALSLLVVEPDWVTRIDHDTDAITATAPPRS
ncbi:hypothetical protein ACFY36_48980 [Actinoplanes sp. NPDC000266]